MQLESLRKITQRKLIAEQEENNNGKNKNLLIESGELEDDFNNHFLSHFGFYDKNLSEYEYGKYHNRWSLEMPKGLQS